MEEQYRFFVSENNVDFTKQVYPRDFGKCKFTEEDNLDQQQIFFRNKLEGRLVFLNFDDRNNFTGDFNYFNSFNTADDSKCQELFIQIQMKCGSLWKVYWTGTFSVGKGYFDMDQCRFEIKPMVYDKYTCIVKDIERKINIVDSPTTETSTIILPDFEYHICRSTTAPDLPNAIGFCATMRPAPLTDGQGNSTWKLLFADDNGIDMIVIYFRERVVVNCEGGIAVPPDGSGWVLANDDCINSDTATWVRFPPGIHPDPNNNPDIQPGYCTGSDGTVEELPPAPVTKTVSVVTSGSGTVTDIRGFSSVAKGSTHKWKVIAPTSSTFVWNINDPGGIINTTSGTTTDTLQIVFNFGILTTYDIDIECVETTICGDVITHQLNNIHVTTDNTLGPPYSGIVLEGPSHLCPNQENVVFEIPEEYRASASTTLWLNAVNPMLNNASYPYYEVVSFNPYQLVIKGKGVETPIGTTLNISVTIGTTVGNFVTAFVPITFRKAFVTDPIIGMETVCPNSTGVIYKVYDRSGSTYLWDVPGGSIVSGQGTNQIVVDWGSVEDDYTVFVKETANCGCIWIELAPCEDHGGGVIGPPYYWCNAATLVTFDSGHLLYDVINYMLEQIGCKNYKELYSDFFEWNPKGLAPGYVAGQNYVTGNINLVNFLSIAQKSDVLNPNASQAATLAELSLKDINLILAEMFQVYWDVDDDGNIYYEHWNYFKYPIGLDLTAYPYSDQKQLRALNKYDYKGDEIPKYERFKFMEAKNRDFIGTEISYDGLCVNQTGENDVKEHTLSNITTDISYIYSNPDEISKDGFVMFANGINGLALTVIQSLGALTGSLIPNAPLSWANLHYDYHRYNRLQRTGSLNNVQQEFLSFLPNVKQVPLSVKMCDCDIITWKPYERIQTELGTKYLGSPGQLKKAEFVPKTKMLKLNLEYPY